MIVHTLAGAAATALLAGCAFEPYLQLPTLPAAERATVRSCSAQTVPGEMAGRVYRFPGESAAGAIAGPAGWPPKQPQSDNDVRPVAKGTVGIRVQPEAWCGDPAAFIGPPRPGPRQLTIHLDSQTFEYSEGGVVVHTGAVTSGSVEHPTPLGIYSVLTKQRDKRSGSYTNYFDMPTPMPYALQFSGPFYVHEGWIAAQPESHGCVRLHREDARFIYERMRVGDRIAVVN
jgi:hypothetical protein